MLGLKVFSFAANTQQADYLEHKKVASRMDLADFIPGAFDAEPEGEVPEDTFVVSSDDSMEVNPIIVLGDDVQSHGAPLEQEEERAMVKEKRRLLAHNDSSPHRVQLRWQLLQCIHS